MSTIVEERVRERLGPDRPVSLELGCGSAKRDPEAIGIDRRDAPGVDIVGDVGEVLAELPTASARRIYSEHFLEHVDDLDRILAESVRVLAPGGELRVVVPHFSNPYFYSDPTHRRWFGLYTFSYLVEDPLLRRRVPHYDTPLPLRLEHLSLGFKSSRPFYGRHACKRAVGVLVNLSRWTQELYEENFTWIVPCYEVEYVMTRC